MRPSPPWDSRAETSRCRQATRNSSWVHDSVRARPASRGHRIAQRGAFSARVRNPTSLATSRPDWLVVALVVVPAVMTRTRSRGRCPGRCPGRFPSRFPARCRSQRGRCSTASSASAARTGRRAPTRARRNTLAASRWFGSVRVWCPGPDPFVIGHHVALAVHLHPVQVCDDLDPPSDHAGGGPSSRWSPTARSGHGPAAPRTATPWPVRLAATPAWLGSPRRSGRSERTPEPCGSGR